MVTVELVKATLRGAHPLYKCGRNCGMGNGLTRKLTCVAAGVEHPSFTNTVNVESCRGATWAVLPVKAPPFQLYE